MISREHRAVFTEELRQRRRGRPPGAQVKVQTGLYLAESLYEAYRRQAQEQRRSVNAVLCDALEQALRRDTHASS